MSHIWAGLAIAGIIIAACTLNGWWLIGSAGFLIGAVVDSHYGD